MHKPKKHYGQNFLRDPNLLKKIVTDADIKDKLVIEVGPGLGALTKYIAANAKQVIAFEIDKDLKPTLTQLEAKHSNLKVIYDDFLNVNLTTLHQDEFSGQPVSLIGNLPYYITTPILFKALEQPWIEDITIMIQKEVAARLIAKPNQKEYNALSLIIQYQSTVKKIVDVDRQMFFPIPNVDSMVIQIKRLAVPRVKPKEEKLFLEIVRASFGQKRKTIVNNWHSCFAIDKNEIVNYLTEMNYKKTIRAEELTLDDFINITANWILK